jgi:hypothetical protein
MSRVEYDGVGARQTVSIFINRGQCESRVQERRIISRWLPANYAALPLEGALEKLSYYNERNV